MNKKNEIAPEDDFIYDITKRGKKPRKADKPVNDRLYDDKTTEEMLLETVKGLEGAKTRINIPLDVLNQLEPDNSQWEALQKWFIVRYTSNIINNAVWEINKAILEEEAPTGINPKWHRTGRTEETEFRIGQPGKIQDMGYNPYVSTYDIEKKISRLAEVYYTLHNEAMKKAYYDNIPELTETREEAQIRQEYEEKYRKREEELKEREEKLNKAIDNAIIKVENENTYLKHELEGIKRKHKEELEKKDTIINRKEAQLQTLEWDLTEREFKEWENKKWDKWREETHGRKRRFEWR